LFERMIDSMTDPEHFSRAAFVRILTEICELFHIAKGVTEFYKTPSHEREHDGEVLMDYDNGRGTKVLLRKRIITRSMAVIIGTLYTAEDEEPLTEEELQKVDLILRAMLSFVSRNRLQNAVEQLGFCDENGYPNVRSFSRYLERRKMENRLGGSIAICFNLRHFSLINQKIGHEKGDIVMHSYYDLLSMAIGQEGIVCRLGGDNFVMMILPEMLEGVLEILKGAPVVYDDENEKRVVVSASAGVFRLPEQFDPNVKPIAIVMDRIYTALGVAKNGQGDSIVFYDEKLLAMKDRSALIQSRFPEALKNGEFRVFYQPKVDVETGKIEGAEALCRWIREGRIVPPGEFIPILEQSTDICQLDYYMLDCACRDINRWIRDGMGAVRVSVNFSRKHLVDANLLEHIMRVIDQNETPHEYIEIELTETTTDVEFRDLKRVVGGLQQEGVWTAVDDFGMGYSSLNLIREIPWNVLKIDKCFLPTEQDGENSVTSRMYRHVIAMGRDLGLECVTEGVETEKQLEILKNNGCQIAQGFFFDKPLPVEEFEERLKKGGY
ncbi:MAG: GGDEF domain-containing phosphodiesterase, partial [Lachnospiraceae bacterium]|nr:GGDEF domain-containing phosphodiesterase [Lachnospiraceae bacterium]